MLKHKPHFIETCLTLLIWYILAVMRSKDVGTGWTNTVSVVTLQRCSRSMRISVSMFFCKSINVCVCADYSKVQVAPHPSL